MKIILASDHGGFELKEYLKKFMETAKIDVVDMGPFKLAKEDDYTDYVVPAMQELRKNVKRNKAVVICRNGVGVSITANKFLGVRAVLSWDPKHAASARADDDTNVLALPADYISKELAVEILGTWLGTNFSNEERHKRRLQKLEEIEA